METKVKICPRCKHENDMYADDCSKCGHSIESVKPKLRSPEPPDQPDVTKGTSPAELSPIPLRETGRIPEATISFDEDPRITFTLRAGMILGRGEQAQIDFSSLPRCMSISKRHAQVFFDVGRWYIEDLKSTNGTTLNGQKLTPGRHELTDGVRIALGNVAFTFRCNP